MRSAEKNVSCVFVRGIAFGVDQKAIEAAFAEIGPLRNCFLVKEKGQQSHKGIGFVHFAIPEDADRAVTALNDTELGGRKILVEHAIKRAPLADRKRKRSDPADSAPEGPAAATPAVKSDAEGQRPNRPDAAARRRGSTRSAVAKPQQPKLIAAAKQRLARTVALSHFSADNKAAAVAAARTVGKVLAVIDPAPDAEVERAKLRNDGCAGDVIFCEYDTISSAVEAVKQLHGLSVERENTAEKTSTAHKNARKDSAGSKATKCSPLWARQVGGDGAHMKAWRVIVRNLPFQITEATLRAAIRDAGFIWELTLPRTAEGKPRGFAFVGFTSRGDAEKAIALVNGQKLGSRVAVVDWAVAKSHYQLQPAHVDAKKAEDVSVATLPESGAGPAVRQALPSSDEDEDETTALPAPEEERSMQRSLLETLVQAQPGHVQSARVLRTSEGITSERSPSVHAGASAAKAALYAGRGAALSTAPAADQYSNRHTKQTVFVRGLPAGTTQQQLHGVMLNYGEVKSCRLVLDQTSRKPKGTAFVEFTSAASAGKAAAACEQHRTSVGPGVMLNSKILDVDAALSQHDARAMASEHSEKHGPKDNRRLYLAKEGTIEEDTAPWEDMSTQDRQRRKRGVEEKNMKLRSPNFYVSPVRLSIRNLPLSVDEAKLKQLMMRAVKERAANEHPHIKQVKILREASKLGKDAKPLSKGLGFVEFTEHEHALCALRQLNNNPHPFGKERRPIIEFAIENVNMVKKREQRLKMQSAKTGATAAPSLPPSAQGRQASRNRSTQFQRSKSHEQQLKPVQGDNHPSGSPGAAGLKRSRDAGRHMKTARSVVAGARPALRPASKTRARPAERSDELDVLVGAYKAKYLASPDRPQVDRRWYD